MQPPARLTVVMPVYNAMPYLQEAVTAVLGQSFRDFQLLAVDDGSTDASLKYLLSIEDPRLNVLQMEGRQGQGAARNRVIEGCDTEYLAFVDADDIPLPHRFERQIAYMDRHPAVGMLGTRFAYIGEAGRPGPTPPLALDHDQIRRDLLLGRHAVANSTLMFRTSVFEGTGAFRINGAGEDLDLFLRMTEQTRVANLDDVLSHYRLHSTSTNAQQAQTLLHRYSHAIECAHLREQARPESSFEDFRARQARRPFWVRSLERLDLLSGMQYRKAVVQLLSGSRIKGTIRLAFAALLSPKRLAQRVHRAIRERTKLQKVENLAGKSV